MTGPKLLTSLRTASSPKLPAPAELKTLISYDELNNNLVIQKVGSPDVKLQIDTKKDVEVHRKEHPLCIRLGAALFYVISSTVITMANKVVLTSFQ